MVTLLKSSFESGLQGIDSAEELSVGNQFSVNLCTGVLLGNQKPIKYGNVATDDPKTR